MLVSTKGRYALRVMLDLAQQPQGAFIPLTDVAFRQDISEKYLESIVSSLSKNKLVDSVRGKGGGYRLNRKADEYTVAEILNTAEGSVRPVSCLVNGKESCPKAESCPIYKMWADLDGKLQKYFGSITLADLAAGKFGEF